jgi:hypothetical protein
MGMVLSLCTLSDLTIARVLTDPPLVWRIVAPDRPEAYTESRTRQGRRGCLAGLVGRRLSAARPLAPLELGMGEDEGRDTDLDKAWHGIHFLLTGTAWAGEPPLDFLVAGGQVVGAEDLGYGPGRVFSSAQVRGIQAAVAAIPDEELARRYSPAKMSEADIYPNIWDRPPEQDDAREYVLSYVPTLREFLTSASRRSMGMLVYLS